MAIEFQSTSLSEGSAAEAGETAQDAVRDALLDHASGAWTLEEEFDSAGGGAIHWVVIKNSASLSDNDQDFYLVIGREVSSGLIGFMLGEVYTAGSNTLSAFAPYTGYPANDHRILPDFTYAQNNENAAKAFVLDTTLPNFTGRLPLCTRPTPLATMRFISIVEKDYAVIHLNTSSFYIGGLIDLIQPDADLDAQIPIGLFDLWRNDDGFGALTRHPIDVSLTPYNVSHPFKIAPIVAGGLTIIQRFAHGLNIYGSKDRYQAQRVAAAEIAAIMRGGLFTSDGPENDPSKVGGIRGKFKGLRMATYPVAVALYDTIAVDGRKHIILADWGTINNHQETYVLPYNAYNNIRSGWVFDTGVAA